MVRAYVGRRPVLPYVGHIVEKRVSARIQHRRRLRQDEVPDQPGETKPVPGDQELSMDERRPRRHEIGDLPMQAVIADRRDHVALRAAHMPSAALKAVPAWPAP